MQNDLNIPWGRCEICGNQTYKKRWAGRHPKFCSKCRHEMQQKYKESLKKEK